MTYMFSFEFSVDFFFSVSMIERNQTDMCFWLVVWLVGWLVVFVVVVAVVVVVVRFFVVVVVCFVLFD